MLLRFSGREIDKAHAHARAMFETRARVFVGPHIWELTRFFVLKGRGRPGALRDRLLDALFAHGRERGVARLLATIDAGLLRHFRRIGLAMTPLGPPFAFAEGCAVVVLVAVPPVGPAVTFLDVSVGRDLDDVPR